MSAERVKDQRGISRRQFLRRAGFSVAGMGGAMIVGAGTDLCVSAQNENQEISDAVDPIYPPVPHEEYLDALSTVSGFEKEVRAIALEGKTSHIEIINPQEVSNAYRLKEQQAVNYLARNKVTAARFQDRSFKTIGLLVAGIVTSMVGLIIESEGREPKTKN